MDQLGAPIILTVDEYAAHLRRSRRLASFTFACGIAAGAGVVALLWLLAQ